MYCRSCGKPIPDDCKFCPYCGCACKAEPTQSSPNPTSITSDKSLNIGINNASPLSTANGRNEQAKQLFNSMSDEKIKKALRFSAFFRATTIISFITVFIYFASAPILSAIDPSNGFVRIWTIFIIAYSLCMIGLSIANVVVAEINKKEFSLKTKPLIGVKVAYSTLLAGLIGVLIWRLTLSGKQLESAAPMIPAMVLTGLCFVTSGLNAGTTQMYILITKQKLKQICPDRKF